MKNPWPHSRLLVKADFVGSGLGSGLSSLVILGEVFLRDVENLPKECSDIKLWLFGAEKLMKHLRLDPFCSYVCP